MKSTFSEELQEYIQENPELETILKSFNETMESYQEALLACGQGLPAQVTVGDTSEIELEQTSFSTASLNFNIAA